MEFVTDTKCTYFLSSRETLHEDNLLLNFSMLYFLPHIFTISYLICWFYRPEELLLSAVFKPCRSLCYRQYYHRPHHCGRAPLLQSFFFFYQRLFYLAMWQEHQKVMTTTHTMTEDTTHTTAWTWSKSTKSSTTMWVHYRFFRMKGVSLIIVIIS